MMLDEPTNHLDIGTREAIEQALIDYEGALLIVSHDEYFVGQMMIDTVWSIQDNKLMLSER
jgi:ATPase subunit of ABC transporter with duplicated ATPase domains